LEKAMEMPGGTFSGSHAKALLVLLLVLPIPGCGGGRAAATVTGTVSYQGKPLPAGKISFWGPNEQVASTLIGEDGSFEASNVPLGLVKVAVSTPLPPPPEIVKAAKEGKRRFGKGNLISVDTNAVSIPAKYSDPAKSGLSLTVTEGSPPYVIELK
jgi:hypothetical protein